jgi:biotin-[acetyl-CoA-carboxylase] ligase BirA-like protein
MSFFPVKRFKFDSLSSTTKKAYELLERGEKAPFYITAKSQENGRGTYEKSWKSPLGGIYLQAVYPFLENYSAKITQNISFILAHWILSLTGEKITIKWPNDLFWKGRKLAGILSEKHSLNQRHFLSIGIGINAEITPSDPSIPYHLASLTDLKKSLPPLEEIINSLIENLHKNFFIDRVEPSPKDFNLFFMQKGTPWYNNQNEYFFYKDLSSEGFLILEDQNKNEVILKSAQNNFSWSLIALKEGIEISTPINDKETRDFQ